MSWNFQEPNITLKSSLTDATSVQSGIIFVPWSLCSTDCFLILRPRSCQFSALSRGSQRPNLPYKMALLEVMGWYILHNWSPENVTCWMLLSPPLLNYYLLHIEILSSRKLIFCEVYWPVTICNSISACNKPNTYPFNLIFCCGHEFQFLGVPKHSRRPSRSTLPTFLEGLKKSVEPYCVQAGSRLRSECEASKEDAGTLFFCP